VRDYLEFRDRASNGSAPRGAAFSPHDFGSLGRAVGEALRLSAGPGTTAAGVAASDYPAPAAGPGDLAYSMSTVAERIEVLYRDTLAATTGDRGAGRTLAATRSLQIRGIGEEPLRRRVRQAVHGPAHPDWINADLHMHSNFSKDCTHTVEALIHTAREIGLGAIALTDHNEIKGAFLAQELAEGDPFVIVAEEIKSKEGEVIGLFLKSTSAELSFDGLFRIKEQSPRRSHPSTACAPFRPTDARRQSASHRCHRDLQRESPSLRSA
jgi:hypothetical protein